ncbi:MAG: Fic family protein [Oligoflexia bacterium]|nr:Fic family protein [Oligoflexia bacterium]
MQEMWKKVRPEILKQLKESAIIQSTESSNRIEGVEVAKDRLLPLVAGTTKPRDRSEEEIAGYRKALNYIHSKHAGLTINSKVIKELHKLAQGGMISDAGKWKSRDNDIIEISPSGDRKIRFKPVSAEDISNAIEQLCLGYQDAAKNNKLPELILVANFVFDFLCIHPFRDGNGRVSRLLTLLLLYQQGYEVGRYISLEKIIENTKDDYYEVLAKSSHEWHQHKHDLIPWWNYFLTTIKSAYQDLKDRVDISQGADTKSTMIRQTILSFNTTFTVADILNLHPNLDRELVKKVLSAMKSKGELTLIGRGRGAKWMLTK